MPSNRQIANIAAALIAAGEALQEGLGDEDGGDHPRADGGIPNGCTFRVTVGGVSGETLMGELQALARTNGVRANMVNRNGGVDVYLADQGLRAQAIAAVQQAARQRGVEARIS